MLKNGEFNKALDLGALLTLLTLSMYALGFLRQAVLYAAIDCFWALKFNSAQDFILQGATGVSVAFFFAMMFSLGRDPGKALDTSLSVISTVGAAWLIFAGLISQYFSIGNFMLAIMSEFFPYALMGPIFYALFSTYSHDGFRKGAGRYLFGCLLIVSMSLFIYQDEKSKEINSGLGSTYMLSKRSGENGSIMVGSINGKYLVRLCGTRNDFSMIEPGSDWIVSAIKSSSDCK